MAVFPKPPSGGPITMGSDGKLAIARLTEGAATIERTELGDAIFGQMG